MYKWLEKNEPDKKVNIVYLQDFEYKAERNKEFIKNNGGEGTSCSHAILKVNDTWLDACEIMDKKKTYLEWKSECERYSNELIIVIPNKLTDNFMKASFENNGWNDMFNRRNLVEMQEVSGVSLKNVYHG